MERTQIYLTKDQRLRLAALGRARGTSLAYVVRDALDRYLATAGRRRGDDDDPLFSLVGAGDDPATDVARHHDAYLGRPPRRPRRTR